MTNNIHDDNIPSAGERNDNEIDALNTLIKEKELTIDKLLSEVKRKTTDLEYYRSKYKAEANEREAIKAELLRVQGLYNEIVESTSWKITKPVRFIGDIIGKVLRSNRFTYLLGKGVKSLMRDGIKETMRKVKEHRGTSQGLKSAKAELYTKKELKAQRSEVFPKDIKFSILVPLYNTPEKFLREMIESVQNQTYSNWELCLADGSDSAHAEVGEIVSGYINKDKRIK